MVLRLLLMKHVRNWSFDTLEREARANLVYRDSARIGFRKDAGRKDTGADRAGVGSEVTAQLHRRLVEIAQQKGVIQGRRMRVDTTVVVTNTHYPTDSSLLGDGARVLTRMKKMEKGSGGKLKKIRDRVRSVNKRERAIATASRDKGPEGEEKREQQYRERVRYTQQILNDARQ